MMGIIGHWSRRKRGLALGMNAIGSSMGGTIFPIAARNLIKRVGCDPSCIFCIFGPLNCVFQLPLDNAHPRLHNPRRPLRAEPCPPAPFTAEKGGRRPREPKGLQVFALHDLLLVRHRRVLGAVYRWVDTLMLSFYHHN